MLVTTLDELRGQHLLCDSQNVSIDEQVEIFLHIVGHNERKYVMQNCFQHSWETISRHFNKILIAVVMLSKHYITPPTHGLGHLLNGVGLLHGMGLLGKHNFIGRKLNSVKF